MRAVIGGISMIVFFNEFFSINEIPFNYHYHSDSGAVKEFKKGNYVMSIKYFQHVLNKYDDPKIGDLVICEQPNRKIKFRIVKQVPRTYYYDNNVELQYYVPSGYVVLHDPVNQQSKMQCIGNVRGNHHYILF